jgi:glutamyl-tRNA synthetase
MTQIRLRFAPSPTGTLHIGTARSALFNWLWARHHGSNGTYVLRIEDTDQERSTPEHVQQALRMFRWLGLDWDEGPDVGGPYGPYFQSERTGGYVEALERLLDNGRAYRCFCTKEQLDADRTAAQAAGAPFVYTGRCRNLDAGDARSRADAGEAHTIRFSIPTDGSIVVDDLVLGPTEFENALIGDFVIARSDGSPLYNFANVVDDAAMHITHVIRGNDHLSNTPKQMHLYEALGYDVPAFAHLPMIHGPDGAKLSKRRHHTATLEQLAEQGYLPAAVRNGLALLGWSRDADTTVMSTEELIEAFEITRVKKSPASIDYDKLTSINAKHLRALAPAAFSQAYETWRDEWLHEDDERYADAFAAGGKEAAYLVQEKVETLGEVPALIGFLSEPFAMQEAAWERIAKVEDAGRVLDLVRDRLTELATFDANSVEGVLRGLCTELDAKPKVVFTPVRIAVTGRTITPGLFESIAVLGRERTIERIDVARERLASVTA